jgi:uncharacterized protein (TIGR02266 family)
LSLQLLARQARQAGMAHKLYQASAPWGGAEVVETLVIGDLAWQSVSGVLRCGAWDPGRSVVWLAGGSAVGLWGTRATPRDLEGRPEAPATPAELRRSERRPVRLKAVFADDRGAWIGVLTDLSAGGAFVATTSPRAPGERVLLDISLDDLSGVTVEAEVRWLRPGRRPGMGVQFVGLQGVEQVRVERALERAAVS